MADKKEELEKEIRKIWQKTDEICRAMAIVLNRLNGLELEVRKLPAEKVLK